MRKIIFTFFVVVQGLSATVIAQTECGSVFNSLEIQSLDPDRFNRFLQVEQHIANFIASNYNGNSNERLITPNSRIIIPIVVHVLHNGEPDGLGNNISNLQVQSQIDVLNEDFRRLNADRVNTPAAFTGLAADPNIEFRLACVDPNGNQTNGINRVQTTVNAFTIQVNQNRSINEQATGIKFTNQGGIDAWPTDRYLNIWVCNIAPSGNGQTLGYAQFPFDFAASPNTDGVVVLNTAFGRVGNLRFQYDLGRTTTHEVGHWLDLFHIWGDDQNSSNICSGSDQCDDTPNQGVQNQSNCPGFPRVSCNNDPNGDMFMNYMDYTVDACKNIFTHGQNNRMRAIFAQGGPRAGFIDNYFRINEPAKTYFCNATVVAATNPSCLPLMWTIVSGSATLSSPTNNQVTVNATGNSTIVVRATAGGYFDEISLSGFNTAPTGIAISQYSNLQLCYGDEYFQVLPASGLYPYSGTLTVAEYNNMGNITWSLAPNSSSTNWSWEATGNTVTVSAKRNNITLRLRATASNACGTFIRDYTFTSGQCLSIEALPGDEEIQSYSLSPNPTTGMLSVSLQKADASASIQEIIIKNKWGVVVKRFKYSNKTKTQTLNLQSLPTDVYVIQVFDGRQWQSGKIIKQ